MEMESNSQEVAKKLWSIVRAVLFMLGKGFSKGFDLHLMVKRSKLAGKAFNELMLHHYAAVSCRSNDALSFISPREYEFSCSNSPAYPMLWNNHKRGHRHRHHRPLNKADLATLATVLEMLNKESVSAAAATAVEPPSPYVHLPGFGKSPMVRQLRVTDSPFPLKDEGDSQVDVAAEQFIKNFHKDLRLQRSPWEPSSRRTAARMWG